MKRILSYNTAIRSGLENFLRAKQDRTGPLTPWQADFLDRLLPFATTGKLLRGSLICFSYEAFTGKPPSEAVIKAAMAVELTHSALLIHDDIMDNDDVRRGQPSIHRQYRLLAEDEALSQPEHFGTGMAMCAGDAALFMAFELLAGCPPAAQKLFTDRLVTTCAGQMQDLHLEAVPGMPSKQAIYDLMQTKTAAYTLALPLAMGAALAGRPPAVLDQLQVIGTAAGTIFQIRDDELGLVGDSRETGKPVGADIREGKKTLAYYHLLSECSAAERTKLRAIFGNPDAGGEAIAYAQQLIEEHGVVKLLNNEIGRLEKQALAGIKALDAPQDMRDELVQLVRFCGNRRS